MLSVRYYKLMVIFYVVALGVLGMVFGSFAGAQVWRLRARQLRDDKATKEPYDTNEYKRLSTLLRVRIAKDRSVCLHCHHTLAWYDLIPIASWLALKGRCRYCHRKIGVFEPVLEVTTASLFILSYLFWPFGFATIPAVAMFVLWLAAIVLLIILAAYDAKWRLLPDSINYSFIGVAAIYALIAYFSGVVKFDGVSLVVALGSLAGLYGALYVVSRGKWIGFGDVKLSIGLAVLLMDWKLALFALFMANLIGCVIVMPALISKKLSAQSKISFGPLLIAGTLISFWWGSQFLTWFFSTSGLYL